MWQIIVFSRDVNTNISPTCFSYNVILTLLKRWDLCYLPLNLGKTVTMVDMKLYDFQEWVTKGNRASSSSSWDAYPGIQHHVVKKPVSHMERPCIDVPTRTSPEVPRLQLHQLPQIWVCKPLDDSTPSLWAVPADPEWRRDELLPPSSAQNAC